VLAAALPILFLYVSYQPSVSFSRGGTTVTAYLSDFAVLAVVVAALVVAVRDGIAPLRRGMPLWVAGALFFAWAAFEVVWGHHRASAYGVGNHAVAAAKFSEYALLAPALVLLVRRRADAAVVLWSLTLWCCAATVVAIAQFFGARVALAVLAGRREASFVGYSDFSALAVTTFVVGLVAISVPRFGLRRLGIVAVVAGGLGTVLAGAIAGVVGAVTAGVVLAITLAVAREIAVRRAAIVVVAVAVVAVGGALIRSNDLGAFARFVGTSTSAHGGRAANVQTYSQRTLLTWIGYRMWLDHPLLGVGWQGSEDPVNFEPYLPAAHRRFPTLAALAFPAVAAGRHYGVQDAWVESLADLGVPGFILWASLFVVGGWLAVTAVLRRWGALPAIGLGGVAALAWLWAAQGIVAGIPLDAATALVFGFAATPVLAGATVGTPGDRVGA
jgi:hypothetical protein